MRILVCIDGMKRSNEVLKIADNWTQGRTLEDLTEKIRVEINPPRKISHLQIWDALFNDYVKLTDIEDIQNGCKINVLTEEPNCPGAIVLNPESQPTPEKPPENECETCFVFEENRENHSQENERGAGAICRGNKLWNKTHLNVWFLNRIPQSWSYSGHTYSVPGGEPGHIINRSDILRLANVWKTQLPPSISKKKTEKVPLFVEAFDYMDSDIRIWFRATGGCRTEVGTDSCSVPKGDKESNKTMTLNLAGDDSYKEHLVIHEFGHALGLGHEHQRAVFWQNVGKFFLPGVVQKCFKMGDKEFAIDVESYGNIPGQDLESAEYDADSIMHYWFRPSWLQPEYSTLTKVDALPKQNHSGDGGITDKERKCLKSFIRRQGKLAEKPSQTDMEFIAEEYYKKLSSIPSTSSAAGPTPQSPLEEVIVPPSRPQQSADQSEADDEAFSEYNDFELSSKDHFNKLYVAAYNARNNWEDLGSALGIHKHTLSSIKINNSSNTTNCFRTMLSKWFDKYENCNLGYFLRALCSDTVEEKEVCKKVREAFPISKNGAAHSVSYPPSQNAGAQDMHLSPPAKAARLTAENVLLTQNGISNAIANMEIENGHILGIYRDLINWVEVATHLGLTKADIQGIKTETMGDPALMNLYTLQRWKSAGLIYGNATYRVLLDALLRSQNNELARELCNLLKQAYK